jgi:di/tripeptidase
LLLRDDDWLTADGTTLGADDGIAIAAMMALVQTSPSRTDLSNCS